MKNYQNYDVINKMEELISELDSRLQEGTFFSITEVNRINELTEEMKLIIQSLLPLQIVRG